MEVPVTWKKVGWVTVLSSIVTGGLLWFQRSGPFTSPSDFVELYNGVFERVMATQYVEGTPATYNRTVYQWNLDTRKYRIYLTNGESVLTNYWIPTASATVQDTNMWNGYSFRVGWPDWNDDIVGPNDSPSLVSTNKKWIWNAYSNLTISGFASASYNGEYLLQKRVPLREIRADYGPNLDTILFRAPLRNPYVWVYTNKSYNQAVLLDAGPLYGIPQTEAARSAAIIDKLVYAFFGFPYAFTEYYDSPLYGPWTYYPFGAASPTVTPTGFASNMIRDVVAAQVINDKGNEYQGPENVTQITSNMVGALKRTIGGPVGFYTAPCLSWGDLYGTPPFYVFEGSAFLDHAETNALGEFPYVTNWAHVAGMEYTNSWVGLSRSVNWTSVTDKAGVSMVWDEKQFPNTNILAYMYRVLRDGFLCTYRRMDDAYLWDVPGGSNNWFEGGGSASSKVLPASTLWAQAKAAAEADFLADPGTAYPYTRPQRYTSGSHSLAGDGTRTLTAFIRSSKCSLAVTDINTNLSRQVDVYLLGRGPNALHNGGFDALGTSIDTAKYTRVQSVGPSHVQDPTIEFGEFKVVPSWCDMPLEGDSTQRGWRVVSEEAVMWWDFQHCTNMAL